MKDGRQRLLPALDMLSSESKSNERRNIEESMDGSVRPARRSMSAREPKQDPLPPRWQQEFCQRLSGCLRAILLFRRSYIDESHPLMSANQAVSALDMLEQHTDKVGSRDCAE